MDLKIINGKKSKTLPIGVDLGSNSVKLAQLRLAEQEIELLAANSIDIPEDCQKDSAKKFDFLNLPKKTYEKSRFLRNIRQNYLMYKSLSKKQIDSFKKTVKDIKAGKGREE